MVHGHPGQAWAQVALVHALESGLDHKTTLPPNVITCDAATVDELSNVVRANELCEDVNGSVVQGAAVPDSVNSNFMLGED
jgi:hypothetical protein